MTNFKNTSLATALTALVLCFSANTQADTQSVSSLLTITGTVTGSVCKIDFPSTINFGETNEISKLASSSASTVAAMSNSKSGLLQVSNCSKGQLFTVKLLGTSDANDANVLANTTGDSYATNVGLRVFTGDSTALNVNETSESFTVDDSGSLGQLIKMGLVKTTDAPTTGDVSISGQLEVNFL